jgi:Xaa-Pro aminopeptidase
MLVTRPPNVRYLTGFTGSYGHVLITTDRAVLLTDRRYEGQSARECPGVEVRAGAELGPAVLAAATDLGVLRVAFESAGITHETFGSLERLGLELVPTLAVVEPLRWVKDEAELVALRGAQAVADEVFDIVVGKLAEGMTERDVALEIDLGVRRLGAEGPAFDTIVAFGQHAAEPHHRPTDRPLGRGDVVKLDFGCVMDGYHSDMTRTVALGEPPAALREVHAVVHAAQRAGVDRVMAGATGGEVDAAARDVVAEAGYGDAFTHGLGHGVGLEIHEGPSLRVGGEDVLPAGAVVTVEPGVYLPGLGGVRIEDMVLVRDGSGERLPSVSGELLVL